MPFSYSARSHPGLRRSQNEDCFVARPDLGLFAVADGLGGHAGGQVASRVAIEAVEAVVAGTLSPEERARYSVKTGLADRAAALVDGFRVGNCRIGLQSAAQADLAGMGTTLVAVLLSPAGNSARPPVKGEVGKPAPELPAAGEGQGREAAEAIVAHVGDSRAYRWSSGKLTLLTHDHSWVEEQVRRGDMTPAEARRHPWRSLITRALTGGEELDVEIDRLPLRPGDRLLLCSDGLPSAVGDEDIGRVLAAEPDDGAACEALVDAANRAGGPDNTTVIVVTI